MASELQVAVFQADNGAKATACWGEIDFPTIDDLHEASSWPTPVDTARREPSGTGGTHVVSDGGG